MEKELEQAQNGIIKVVLFGPESTGKTTLTKALADFYNTQFVPEYMRIYLQEKWDKQKEICAEADMIPIAKGQIALENTQAEKAQKILFCDTNLLQNWVYARVYFENYSNPLLEKYVNKHDYQLYILCDIDVPWQADDLRDKPNEREKMFSIFAKELIKRRLSYIHVKGSLSERLAQCKPVLQNLLNKQSNATTD